MSVLPNLRPVAPRRPLDFWVDWRAAQIGDPVRRLRYLRGSAAYWASRPIRSAMRNARVHRAGVFLAILLFPIAVITDGASPVRPMADDARYDVLPNIWLAESTPEYELYSNGLRIEKTHTARPEGARPFQRWSIDTGVREERPTPYGIVFHTTESDSAAFLPDNAGALTHQAKNVMSFVRNRRAYHYVVDRFGRVYRTVPENEPANHAGHSIWADNKFFFVNLNHSFLGISFDGQTRGPDGNPTATEAQIQSATRLTALIRSRYRIPAANCVTHGQVSVNPGNRRVGYHTDWATGFPYAKIGLPLNYHRPLPAITLFGFHFDDAYADVASEELQDGISAGETILRQEAMRRSLSPAAYRKLLLKRYKEVSDPNARPSFAEPTPGTSPQL